MKKEAAKKKPNVLVRIIKWFFWIFIGLAASFSILNKVDQATGYQTSVFGYHYSVVISDSMSAIHPDNYSYLNPDEIETIQKFDLIITKRYETEDQVQQYDVVTFIMSDGVLCTHRIIDSYESNGKRYFVTKGDANNAIDTPIDFSLIIGKYVAKVPSIGNAILFVQCIYFLIGVFGCVFFVSGAILLIQISEEKKEKHKPASNSETKINENKALKNAKDKENKNTKTTSK